MTTPATGGSLSGSALPGSASPGSASPGSASPGSASPGSDQSTAAKAKDEAGSLAQNAGASAKQVAGTAKEQAGAVASEAAAQARDLMGEARSELSGQAAAQQQRAAAGLRSLSDELRSMTTHAGDSGVATHLAGQAASHAETAAGWLENRDPGGLVDEVKEFARRRPLAFLAVAAAAGLVAGRLTRGAVAEARESDDSGRHEAGSQTPAIAGSAGMPGSPVIGTAPITGVRPYATSDYGPADQEVMGLESVAAEYPLDADELPREGISGARPVGGIEDPR